MPTKAQIAELREKQIKETTWTFLGSGAFNTVEVSQTPLQIANDEGETKGYNGRWVRKKAKKSSKLTELSRQSRLFRAIEPDMPLREHKEALYMPFLQLNFKEIDGCNHASDEERAQKCLDIFKTTGRILLDAMIQENIFSQKGKVVCIDIDVALRPDSPLGRQGFFNLRNLDEKTNWYEALRGFHLLKHKSWIKQYPLTHKVLQGLILLSEHFSWDKLPEALLTLDVMDKLHTAKDAGENISAFIDELTHKFQASPQPCTLL